VVLRFAYAYSRAVFTPFVLVTVGLSEGKSISSVLDVRNKTNNDILTFSQNKLTLFLLIKKTRVHISHRYSHPASQATFKRSLLILVLHVLLNA
jgi:hypothetical protein